MKTLCGLSGYKTLPNKYKTSAYSTTKEPPYNPSHILPPRPCLARSSSFSESKKSNNLERHTRPLITKEKKISRSGSLYLPNTDPTPKNKQPECSLPLSRSLSLANLQPGHGHAQLHDGYHGHVAPSSGQNNHAGIWARGRRANSCRNLRDINQHSINNSELPSLAGTNDYH